MLFKFIITFLKRIYIFTLSKKKKIKRLGDEVALTADEFAKNFRIAQNEFHRNPNSMIDLLKNYSIYDFWIFYVASIKGPHYRMPWKNNSITKMPMDVWIYKNLIYKNKPNLIIEIGTQRCESAKLLKELSIEFNTKIITFDIIKPSNQTLSDFKSLDISFFNTDATNLEAIDNILSLNIKKNDIRAMVIDDGSHRRKDVLNSFHLFKDLIPKNGFYIIEDGFTNELTKNSKFLAMDAVRDILDSEQSFHHYDEYNDFLFSSAYFGILQKK